MSPSADSRLGPGRPRSARADRAILDATMDLLAADGFDGLTMEGIAERAGVGKATLYRRYKSRTEVVVATVAAFVEEIAIPDTGMVEKDLILLEQQAVEVYQGRAGRVLPGLLAAMAASADVADAMRTGFLRARRQALAAVVKRGVARGELREDTNVELALDLLGGPLFYRLLVTGGSLDDLARGVVKIMLHGMASSMEARGGVRV